MKINKITLKNFRNYDEVNLTFAQGVNFFQGENGAGKTSLVEAIGMLPHCKSIRSNDEKEVIKFGKEFASIEVEVENQKVEKIKIVISQKGKMVKLNDYELKKASEIVGIVKVISFLPRDGELFKEAPLKRRKFIDLNLSMLDKTYLRALSEYNNYLNQIRVTLKSEVIDEVYLSVLIQEISKRGLFIQQKRKKFIYLLNEEIKSIGAYLEDDETEMKLVYLPCVEEKPLTSYSECIYQKVLNSIKSGVKSNIEGIHSDDISFLFNKNDLAKFGSQGQNRLSVIALKLALFKLIKEKFKEEPIVILDDVLSELDNKHQEKLIKLLNRIEQVFITGTSILLKNKYELYTVEGNTIRRKA